MDLIFAPFVRKPFSVEAVQVTEENMKEVAKLLGRIETEPSGKVYIEVYKGRVPKVTRVYVGYWLTRLHDNVKNLRVYTTKTFDREFEASPVEEKSDANSGQIQSYPSVDDVLTNEDEGSVEAMDSLEPQVADG